MPLLSPKIKIFGGPIEVKLYVGCCKYATEMQNEGCPDIIQTQGTKKNLHGKLGKLDKLRVDFANFANFVMHFFYTFHKPIEAIDHGQSIDCTNASQYFAGCPVRRLLRRGFWTQTREEGESRFSLKKGLKSLLIRI